LVLGARAIGKSFLLLFFKKEESSFLKKRSKRLVPFAPGLITAHALWRNRGGCG
jgi:hypothetical protein